MTVGSTISRVDYDGTGTTGPFPIPFYFQADADIRVTHISALGVVSDWALGANFILTGAGDPAGGEIEALEPLETGERIIVRRAPPQTQTVDLVVSDDLPAEVLENAIDKLTMMVQALQEQVDRCIRFPLQDGVGLNPSVPPLATRRTRLFGWDANGNPQAISIGGGNVADALVVAAAAQSAANTAQATADNAVLLAQAAQARADAAHGRIDGLPGDDFEWTGTHSFQGPITLVGTRLDMARASVAAGSTTNLANTAGNYVSISGAASIAKFGSAPAGAIRYLRFNGVSTIVNSAEIICPGGADIVTAVGDTAIVVSEGGGIWRVFDYRPADAPLGGVFREQWESAPFWASNNTTTAIQHTLSGRPKLIQIGVRSLDAASGFEVGAELVDVSNWNDEDLSSGGNTQYGIHGSTPTANTVAVRIGRNGPALPINFGANGAFAKYFIRAWR